MNTFKAIGGAGVTVLLVACSAANTERTSSTDTTETVGGPIESNTARTNAATSASVAVSPPPAPAPAVKALRSETPTERVVAVPEDVRRDPARLMTVMQQVRKQIVDQTRKMPDSEYEQLVRPSLAPQLRALGFADNDVDEILSDVDYSRRIQGLR